MGRKRNGFTLLELMVVIIILGILATLGLTQYNKVIEKTRGAEAREVLGSIRVMAYARWLETQDTAKIDKKIDLGIGSAASQIPGPSASQCRDSHYFWYDYAQDETAGKAKITATRCKTGEGTGGKPPSVRTAQAGELILHSNFVDGKDWWEGVYR